MRVYRIATAEGTGPYRSSRLPACILQALRPMYNKHHDINRPTPELDFPRHYMGAYDICAFSSQAQLLDWFDGFEELLAGLGFIVWELEVPEMYVRELERQTIIDKYAYSVVATYSLV